MLETQFVDALYTWLSFNVKANVPKTPKQGVAGSFVLRMQLVCAYQSTNSSGIWITQIEGTLVAFIHTFDQHLMNNSDPKSIYILKHFRNYNL